MGLNLCFLELSTENGPSGTAYAIMSLLENFSLPEEWQNDERMGYLFGPFPPGRIPSENNEKLCFWSKLIVSSSKQLNKTTFTVPELQTRFTRRGVNPTCLLEVVAYMERTGVIQRLDKWSTFPSGVSWSGWAQQATVKGLWYLWESVVGKYEDDQIEFIIVDQIKVCVSLNHVFLMATPNKFSVSSPLRHVSRQSISIIKLAALFT